MLESDMFLESDETSFYWIYYIRSHNHRDVCPVYLTFSSADTRVFHDIILFCHLTYFQLLRDGMNLISLIAVLCHKRID